MANYKPKPCKICGNTFTPRSSTATLCSEHCRKINKQTYMKKWGVDHPAYFSTQSKRWYAENRDLAIQRAKEWQKNNAEQRRATSRKYAKENAAKIAERRRNLPKEVKARYARKNREWRSANNERLRELDRARRKRWESKNADKVGALAALRARVTSEGDATPELIEQKWRDSNHACILCGQPIDDTLHPRHRMSRTLEHLTPIARGGRHDIDNISFAHRSCNSQKQDKTLDEYREWQANLRKAG